VCLRERLRPPCCRQGASFYSKNTRNAPSRRGRFFVPFPYGYALGKPNDPDFQHKVLSAALELFKAATGPVLAEFTEKGDAPARLIQASAVRNVNTEADPADELTMMRRYYEQWVESARPCFATDRSRK
jgi:hypothetical protein